MIYNKKAFNKILLVLFTISVYVILAVDHFDNWDDDINFKQYPSIEDF